MVVITLSECPPKLRGDMTKWMLEISTGVYVGNFSARVRENLWKRICENIGKGRATMIYSTSGEQHFGFEVHNSRWQPVDYDGAILIKHISKEKAEDYHEGDLQRKENLSSDSDARKNLMKRRKQRLSSFFHQTEGIPSEKEPVSETSSVESLSKSISLPDRYVVIDLETTGLRERTDEIIEIAALLVIDGIEIDSMSRLIRPNRIIPETIEKLTGITNSICEEQGVGLEKAINDLKSFVGNEILVCHNVIFDFAFLEQAFKRTGIEPFQNTCIDTLKLARKKINQIDNYKLATIAGFLGIEVKERHRAMADCRTTFGIYEKLKVI